MNSRSAYLSIFWIDMQTSSRKSYALFVCSIGLVGAEEDGCSLQCSDVNCGRICSEIQDILPSIPENQFILEQDLNRSTG